ncbi:MAG: aldo/keto reductase [Planctomycetes bacterium]|nr:aldo/keto reductase [Planctomycetota bacterium]
MSNPTMTAVIETDTYRRFGRTDLRVSPLGFGGAPIGNLETEPAIVGRILNRLIDRGVNLIDTAHAYHASEEVIGAAIAGRRDEVVLVSKCGSKWDDDDLPPAWTPEYVRATIERSLRRLRTDRIDVMLLHSCDLEKLQTSGCLEEVVAARDAGKVRFAGYSGDNEAAAWAARHPDIAVVQTSIGLCDQRNIAEVLPATTAHDVGVMAKRPLSNAAWKTLEDQYERYRSYEKPYRERFEAMALDLDAVRTACGEPLDWPEIALRFTLAFPAVHTAIVGTTRPQSVDANLAAASKGPLPAAGVALIRATWRGADPDTTWPGLT